MESEPPGDPSRNQSASVTLCQDGESWREKSAKYDKQSVFYRHFWASAYTDLPQLISGSDCGILRGE